MILNPAIVKENTFNDGASGENPIRSLAKSISWRVLGTLDTMFIAWLITGAIAVAITIGSIEIITKMTLFFFHERIWNNIKWDK